MQRRKFIKKSSLLVGSAVLASSCEDKTAANRERKFEGTVGIIGAGAGGLYAAYLLEQNQINYTIFEASDQIGGRIRSLKGLADFDIELGAEFIHGKRSVWHDSVKNAGATIVSVDNFLDYFQINNNLWNENQLTANADFKASQTLLNQALNYSGNDISLTQLIDNSKLPISVRHIVEAQVANEAGAPANLLSIKGITEEAQAWSSGEETLISTNKSFLSVINSQFQNIIPKVKLSTPIKKIDYGVNMRIMIEDSQAQRYYFDKLILTVPISILKNNEIQFNPVLPTAKLDAIKNIGMGAGMKITLVFNQRFWAADATSIYMAGTVPEFIVSSLGRSTQSFVLSGFVTGSKAENLTKLSNEVIIQNAVSNLDAIYGNKVATNALINARVTDWTKEPYIKGSYSYPLVGGGGLLTRQALASPLLRQLYFAGEATHYGGHNSTVHGAMESAQRAVNELMNEVI